MHRIEERINKDAIRKAKDLIEADKDNYCYTNTRFCAIGKVVAANGGKSVNPEWRYKIEGYNSFSPEVIKKEAAKILGIKESEASRMAYVCHEYVSGNRLDAADNAIAYFEHILNGGKVFGEFHYKSPFR